MSPMFKKVAYTMIPVKDAARAAVFYEETLGLAGGAAHGAWSEYDLPGGGCLLLGPAKGREPSATAGSRVALEVADLDALVTRLRSLRVRFAGELVEAPVCRMVTILDSEGNALILHQLGRG
jgi:predicted enzyme related to lactoylglutathione lyase